MFKIYQVMLISFIIGEIQIKTTVKIHLLTYQIGKDQKI